MSRNGTSIPEQSIFYYVRQFFPETQNRFMYKSKTGDIVEIDIFVPSIKLAIEYDGAFWHKDKADDDTRKNVILNNDGIYVIRVRDLACPKLPNFVGKIFLHGKAPRGMHTNEYVQAIINDIAQFCDNSNLAKRLNEFKLSFEKYVEDQPDILSLIYSEKVVPNKSGFCGAEFWDNEANGQLSLDNISADDNAEIYVNFLCKMGQSIHAPIKVLRDKKECKIKCDSCINNFCPFVEHYCKGHCDLVFNQLNDYLLHNSLMIPKPGNLSYYYINEAPWIMKLVEYRTKTDDMDYIERFDKYFGFPIFCGQKTINLSSIQDLQIAKEYCEKCGGLIEFEILAFDNSKEKINAVRVFFDTVRKKLIEFREKDYKHIFNGIHRNYVHSIYCYWSRNKANMSEVLQEVIITFIKKVEEKILPNSVEFRHKFD